MYQYKIIKHLQLTFRPFNLFVCQIRVHLALKCVVFLNQVITFWQVKYCIIMVVLALYRYFNRSKVLGE